MIEYPCPECGSDGPHHVDDDDGLSLTVQCVEPDCGFWFSIEGEIYESHV